MPQLIALHAVVAIAAPALIGWMGRRVFYLLALAPASAAVYAASLTPRILAGEVITQTVSWVPLYGMDIVLRMDTLSWVMTLIVGGVGALVLMYSAEYFSPNAHGLGRFAGSFVAFAGAMLGLVVSDNTLMMYVFWELTSLFSFILIGHYHERQGSRRAALQAIIVTTSGGLAMLGGIIILGVMPGGSFLFSELVPAAATGALGGPQNTTLLAVAIVLVLAGAVSKSALVPFHYWLPNAMAAPTPVSAYLHSSAMVKAGVFLVARMAPGFADVPIWRPVVLTMALATMLLGGYRALRQHDLKLVLAFGTVSQLGFITALVGYGDAAIALAGLAMLVAHSMFKATLFLTVGIVDWSTGTRDLRELSGFGRREPVLATIAAVAALSMMGAPPTSGYVAKEAALHGLWGQTAQTGADGMEFAIYLLVALGSVLTAAYTLRFWWGTFMSKPGVAETPGRSCRDRIVIAPIVTATAVLVLGLLPAVWERALAGHAATYPGEAGHLTLWGGFGVPLWTTVAILALGVVLFAARRGVEALQNRAPDWEGAEGVYRRSLRWLDSLAADVTAAFQRGSLPGYLSVILMTMVVLLVARGLVGDVTSGPLRLWDSVGQALVAVVMIVATVLVVRARRRLKAVALLGIVGYGMVLIFEFHGAPDLGLTQILAESITLVIFILVLRRLPTYFSNRPLLSSWFWRLGIAVATGVVVAGTAVVASWSRVHEPVSVTFPQEAYHYGYGANVVNVTLVDVRAWDTMGEISVVVAAATGVASLIYLRRRHGRVERAGAVRPKTPVWSGGQVVPEAYVHLRKPDAEAAGKPWLREYARGRNLLAGSRTLAPHRRSVTFELGVRIIFPTLMVFGIYLLFAGHNAPGGGFAAGLVVGAALGVRYLAGGRFELFEAMPIQPGVLMGSGLIVAVLTALAPIPFGGTVLQSYEAFVNLGPLGEIHLVSAMVFDIGVFLVVVGMMVDILHTLGAELDRQQEVAGEVAPEVAHDDAVYSSDDVLAALSITPEEFLKREKQIRRRHARGVWEEDE